MSILNDHYLDDKVASWVMDKYGHRDFPGTCDCGGDWSMVHLNDYHKMTFDQIVDKLRECGL